MRTHYDPGLNATVTWDDAGRVRGILYFDKYREMENLRGRAAAEAYIRDVAKNLNIAPEAVRGIEQPVSYLDPREQGVEYRFSEEKVSFDTTTYVYCQTYLNAPVWGAGITVTLKQARKQAPTRVVAATDTSQQGIDAKLPSPKALERYRRLFASGGKVDGPRSRRKVRRPQEPDIASADLLTDILGGAAKVAKGLDDAQITPRLIRGRFFIYRYDAKERTKDESLTLPLPAVPKSIQDGSWYLAAELVFRLPYGRTRMNWRILVEVETNAILCVRALSSGVIGNVFTYDPVTSTGKATHTSDRNNKVLNRHRKREKLHNLKSPTRTQSLKGTFAKVINETSPDFQPPTRPAGSNFDIWDVRTNEFAAVNAYYHVDRFFRLVEDLGFQVMGPNGYFGGTHFPVEVDHRAFRAPWPDGNVVNSALVGLGSGIDSIYYALADFRGGSVARVTVTKGGSRYTSPPRVELLGGQGSGATAKVKPEHIRGGAVTKVTVTEKGVGYTISPLVKFSGGGGTGAFAVAEIDDPDPIGIATDWRVTLHELGGHGTLWSHVEDDQFKFAHSAGDSFAMILTDYLSAWHNNGHVPDRFLLLPFLPSVIVRRSDRGVEERSVARVNVTNPGSGYLTVSLRGGGVNEAKARVKPGHIVDGAVTKVIVTDPGTGYTSAPLVNFSGDSGGTGATATAQIASGSVTAVTVTNRGSGYASPPMVNFVGGGPAKAGVLPQHIIAGTITKVTALDPGMGYTSAPNVIISGGGGRGAKAAAQIADGKLATLTVTDGGSGYSAPRVELSGGGVREAKAVVKPAHIVDGAVTKVTVTGRGTGYTWAPSVTIIDSGDGSGATATAEIASGSVTRVTVTDGGSGYRNAAAIRVVFTGGGVANARVKPEDVVDGRVTKVTVADPGTGYTRAPSVVISGGGSSDAEGTAETGTWGWGKGMDQGTDGRIGSGYFSEQILSTTMFRAYRSIGGDATSIDRREFAARYMAYLMLRAIQTLSPPTNPYSPDDFLRALQTAEAGDWTSEKVVGGAYGKVLAWAFEKQHLNKGAPPSVDVYIDDNRAGEYEYKEEYWAATTIWNRRNPDGLNGHQEPALGQTNFAYVKVKNRGTSVANDVVVKGYHCKPSAGLLWPNDLQPLTTPQLPAGTLRPNNAEEKTVGPFEWTPVANAWGHDCMLMIVSAPGDLSNVENIAAGEVIEDWRLVPNDNNIAQRNVVLVPGGGGRQGLAAGLHGKGLWVGNPGRSAAKIAVAVALPPLLARRGWRIGLRDLPADGVRLNAREQRLVTFDVQAGASFTKADAKAATKRNIVVTVTANGAIVGGMVYRIEPELATPFNERASAPRGSAQSSANKARRGDKRRRTGGPTYKRRPRRARKRPVS